MQQLLKHALRQFVSIQSVLEHWSRYSFMTIQATESKYLFSLMELVILTNRTQTNKQYGKSFYFMKTPTLMTLLSRNLPHCVNIFIKKNLIYFAWDRSYIV